MPIELQDKLYTSAQVADILGVSLRTLYRYMEDGRIQSMRTASGRHRFTKEQIVDFLNAGNFDPEVDNDLSYGSNNRAPSDNLQPARQSPVYEDDDSSDDFDVHQSTFQVDRQPKGPSYRADNFQTSYNAQQERSFESQPKSKSDDFAFYKPEDKSPFRSHVDDAFESFSGNKPVETEQRVNSFKRSSFNDGLEDDIEEDDDTFDFDMKSFAPRPSVQPQPGVQQRQSPPFMQPRSNTDSRGHTSEPVFSRPVPAPMTQQNRPVVERFNQRPQMAYRPVEQTRQPLGQPAQEERFAPQAPQSDLQIRFYKSEYNDLIELAKKIKETAINKDLECAFTLNAGVSLHFSINPFTILHFYVNPEDIQLWKNELRLNPVRDMGEANVGILINTDVVFMPTREIGGFRVVEDKLLLKDLMKLRDEELVKKFRQNLVSA